MLTQSLEAHVNLFDPVPLSFVPPGHGHRLLLGDGVAEAVEAQATLAAQELRRAGALSLQHLGFALVAGNVGVLVHSAHRAVLGRGVQADAGASFAKSKGECSLRGGDGRGFHLAKRDSLKLVAGGEELAVYSSRVLRVGTVWLTVVQVSLDCLLHEPI